MAKVLRKSQEVFKRHNSGQGSGLVVDGAFATTTDNTATTVLQIPVAENEGLRVHAKCFALRSTGAEAIRSNQEHAFRREGSNNVTAVGAATSVAVDDSGGTPTLTLVANTTDQTVDVKVTGETSKEFAWDVIVEYQKVSQ